MSPVKRTLVFNTRIVERRQYRVELEDSEEAPTEEEMQRMDLAALTDFVNDHEDCLDWDTIAEDEEEYTDGWRLLEEVEERNG